MSITCGLGYLDILFHTISSTKSFLCRIVVEETDSIPSSTIRGNLGQNITATPPSFPTIAIAMPLTRVQATRAAIPILRLRADWSQAMVVAQAAVKLLPRICSRYATRDDQQYALIQTSRPRRGYLFHPP
jgi:hypothetical protein